MSVFNACLFCYHQTHANNQILDDFNENTHTKMNLVLFDDALEHLTRIHRVLRIDRGNSLLVGVNGSGKQSLCQLASYTAGCQVFQIMLSRGYNENSLRSASSSICFTFR